MTDIYKGGRGLKAPYETTHVRIPVAIKKRVENLSKAYKQGEIEQLPEPITLAEAIEIARQILKQKKSARVSLENLLTRLYSQDISL